LIEEQFQVPGLGTVISGFVTRGEWQKGESLFVGPMKDGTLFRTTPKSVHVAQTLVDHVWAGHSVCFAISKPPRGMRNLLGKGMVALKESFQVSRKFTADVILVKGNTITVAKDRFVTTAHILHNKQSVRVIGIHGADKTNQETARQGDRATITFEFIRRPFHVRQGMRIISFYVMATSVDME
jgi:GTPase